MDDPLDVFADAMLADPVVGEVATAVAAYMQALWRYRRRIRRSRLGRRRYIGSVRGRRLNKHGDFRSGLRAILRDYFGLNGSPPVYDEADFERRFRVPRSVFLRIYHAVKGRPFFAQRINATGIPQAHPLQKVVAAFRVIVHGEAPDRMMNTFVCPHRPSLCLFESFYVLLWLSLVRLMCVSAPRPS